VYYHTIRFYKETLTVTASLYWKLHYTARIATSASKNNYHCFVLKTNTDYVGGFLQVYHYWWVNICCKVLNLGLWKLWTRNWSHYIPTTKSTPFMVSKDEWDTKKGPGKSMKNALYVLQHGKRHLLGWSDVEQRKYQAHILSHCRITWVGRHQAGRQAGS